MKKLKILIADDEEFLQEIYEMILETEHPCQFVRVSNGDEAIKVLKENTDFDLIVSDYNMPGSNGGKIYLFNKEHQNIPFFLFSADELDAHPEFKDFKTTNDLNHFFTKPFNENDLLKATNLIQEKVDTEKSSSL